MSDKDRDIPDGIYEVKSGGLVRLGDHLPLKDIKASLAQGRCPDCLAFDWRPGPRGGASRNIECRNCRARFNVAVYAMQLISAERLESEAEGGGRWREDWFPR